MGQFSFLWAISYPPFIAYNIWGAIVAVFCILSTVLSMVNGGEFNFMSILTGVAVPALYIYGAVLNSKTEDEFAA